MNLSTDYYAILGVLPSAEDVVIRAAYRALAQRYHPDRYGGPNAEAGERMAELNEAWAVLSDSVARAEYDQVRGTGAKSADAYFKESKPESPPGADPLEKDWQLAISYYPDLASLEARLAKVSWRLAYSYRVFILDSKNYEKRAELAAVAETQFLQVYFGDNPKIVNFARSLIQAGQRRAAKALNEAARVLGSNVDPTHIITKITTDYGLLRMAETDRRHAQIRSLAEAILENPRLPVDQKINFLTLLGGEFIWNNGFFNSSCRVTFQGIDYTFDDGRAFGQWLVDEIAPQIVAKSKFGTQH